MAFLSTGTKVKFNGMEVSVIEINAHLIKEIAEVKVVISDDLTINKLEEMALNGMLVQIETFDGSVLNYKADEVMIEILPQEIIIAYVDCDRIK